MGGWWGAFAALGLAAAPQQADESPRWAKVVSSLTKVRPGQVPAGEPGAQLLAGRGECESFQVVVAPGHKDVSVEALTLEGPGGKLPVQLMRVGYVPVRTPSNSEGTPGLWPDPLLPLSWESTSAASEKKPSRPAVAKTWARVGSTDGPAPLVLWGDVCVPASQKPGTYTGRLQLRAEGGKSKRLRTQVPVSLEVRPFTLPATSSLTNTFGISLYSVSRGHGLKPESKEARELLHAYARMALEHRISLHGMFIDAPPLVRKDGKVTVDFTGYDAEMAPYFEGTAVSSGARFTAEKIRDTGECKTDEEHVAYLAAWREHFREKGWKTELFFYAKDEPKPHEYPLVRRQSALVRKAGGLPVLVTSPLEPRLHGAADILTPVLNCFFPRGGPETCPRVRDVRALRKALGSGRKRVWWYQSCMSHGCDGGPAKDARLEEAFRGWASYMVDHPAPLNRAMGVLAFNAGVDGELYFDTVAAYNTKKNPWEDVFEFGGNGDGTLFYPGTPAALGGAASARGHVPVASIRLKIIRDGLEDYEYLRLLASKGQERAARIASQRLARTAYDIERNPHIWRELREGWASKLGRLDEPSEYGGSGSVGR